MREILINLVSLAQETEKINSSNLITYCFKFTTGLKRFLKFQILGKIFQNFKLKI